jgi:hypothetical protein
MEFVIWLCDAAILSIWKDYQVFTFGIASMCRTSRALGNLFVSTVAEVFEFR